MPPIAKMAAGNDSRSQMHILCPQKGRAAPCMEPRDEPISREKAQRTRRSTPPEAYCARCSAGDHVHLFSSLLFSLSYHAAGRNAMARTRNFAFFACLPLHISAAWGIIGHQKLQTEKGRPYAGNHTGSGHGQAPEGADPGQDQVHGTGQRRGPDRPDAPSDRAPPSVPHRHRGGL